MIFLLEPLVAELTRELKLQLCLPTTPTQEEGRLLFHHISHSQFVKLFKSNPTEGVHVFSVQSQRAGKDYRRE